MTYLEGRLPCYYRYPVFASRFDHLAKDLGLEKISTLGDCYYCVAGCPEPCDDHAKRTVEMGLEMIVAIAQFDLDRGQEVNMRVGIHTGKVSFHFPPSLGPNTKIRAFPTVYRILTIQTGQIYPITL